MSAARDPLARYVRPRLTEERVAKQYAAVVSRLPSRGPRRLPGAIGFALAGAALALILVFTLRRGPSETTLADGTWLESAPSGPAPAVTLADGSRVTLGARSRVRLTSTRAEAVRLDVERGRVDVQATHREGRSFVVAAGDVEVRVVGTRFSVTADGAVRVRVEEGRVAVRTPGGERAVSGGEEWVEDEARAEEVDAGIDAAGDEELEVDDAGGAPPAPRGVKGPTAKGLLDEAQRALAEGRTREAARLFDGIRRDHRRDLRAGLAAFELGRLRLDALGDPAGAEEAFRDALRLARDGALRDDAEAARVEALDRMGSSACARARDAYLQHRPRGVHRAAVAARCGGT